MTGRDTKGNHLMGIIIEEEVFREMTMVEVNTKEEEAREEMIRIILVTRIR